MPVDITIESITFSETSLNERPEHAAVLGRIFTSWSLIETAVAGLLGLMMHADHRAAVAVLETFNSNHGRVTAVKKIGKQMLAASLQKDFDALMNEVLSYAKERNAIAHHVWGVDDAYPDVVYRIPMAAISRVLIEAPVTAEQILDDLEGWVSGLKKEIAPFTLKDLLEIEQRGHALLKKVMTVTMNKGYQSAIKQRG